MPTDPLKWLVFAAIFFLGIASCSLLGIAYTRLIRSGGSAPAIVQPPYLILQFISGVFMLYSEVPAGLRVVASIFPLKSMVQGFPYAFLPDWVARDDYGGGWQIEQVFLVLAAWFVASFVLARLFFRWNRGVEKRPHDLSVPAQSCAGGLSTCLGCPGRWPSSNTERRAAVSGPASADRPPCKQPRRWPTGAVASTHRAAAISTTPAKTTGYCRARLSELSRGRLVTL